MLANSPSCSKLLPNSQITRIFSYFGNDPLSLRFALQPIPLRRFCRRGRVLFSSTSPQVLMGFDLRPASALSRVVVSVDSLLVCEDVFLFRSALFVILALLGVHTTQKRWRQASESSPELAKVTYVARIFLLEDAYHVPSVTTCPTLRRDSPVTTLTIFKVTA